MASNAAKFFKYQALGNDMIVIDPSEFGVPLTPDRIRRYCQRHFGIGADGICYGPLNADRKEPFEMRFFNPDGSESEKSGNGLRIFARYLFDCGYVNSNVFRIAIGKETATVHVLDPKAQKLAVEMGKVSFYSDDVFLKGRSRLMIGEMINIGGEKFEITAVSVGNPHCIIFTEDLNDIHSFGPQLETAPQFLKRTNVQAVKIIDRNNIQITIWERGAGHTLASGTSATATAAAAVRLGFCSSPVTVRMEGGTAQVNIENDWRATLIGAVSAVFQGQVADDLL